MARNTFLSVLACLTFIPSIQAQNCLYWSETPQSAPQPAPREHHALAYDPLRDRIVLFGGFDEFFQLIGDTWEWNGTIWTQLALPPALSPGHREAGAFAFDSARSVAVYFGGDDLDGLYRGDTWEWDGATWTLVAEPPDPGPSPRSGFSFVHDDARSVSMLFGGEGDTGVVGETWTWDGAAWTQHLVPGPSPRSFHAAAYDSSRQVVVLFGGFTGSSHSRETWEWNGLAWTLRANNGPSARSYHAMAYDTDRGVTVLFGGNPGLFDNDRETWEWDGLTWSLRLADGPSTRHHSIAVYDSARRAVTLFGGHDWSVMFNDLWRLKNSDACDTNCDGSINPFDIQPFVNLLANPSNPGCSPCAADANGNGTVNPFDIQSFLACLS